MGRKSGGWCRTWVARVHVEPHRKGGRIGDATIADAILDRLLSCRQRLAFKGKSLRPDRLAAIPYVARVVELRG